MRSGPFAWLIVAGACQVPIPSAAGEELQDLVPGMRVRVLSLKDSGRTTVVGNLLSVTEQTMTIETEGDATAVISLPAVSKVEVSRGTRHYAGKGALAGLALGVAVALVWVLTDEGEGPRGQIGTYAALSLGGVGAGVGAMIGAAIKTDRWEPARLPIRSTDTFGTRPQIILTVRLAF